MFRMPPLSISCNRTCPSHRTLALLCLATIAISARCAAQGTYQSPQDFLREAFGGAPPEPSKLWLDENLKAGIRAILEHDLDVLRLRYWGKDGKTAWILEEIGKERPITTGIVIERGTIERIKVLVFRESRGWEVRYPFFTDQFTGATLGTGDQLDRGIDGISGATLSVRALTRLARLALFLHAHSDFADGKP
ncbi:MAG: FMN-binding protein [Gammaproteobacteria bacterium]